MKSYNKYQLILLFSFLSAVILRIAYLLTPQLDSDFAVIGLAGRHILKGKLPLFFYGGYFEGIIYSYIAAPLFWLFGSSRLVLDCIPACISLALIYATFKLAQKMFGKETAAIASIFTAIAPPYFLFMVTVPMEGYIETAILGTVLFLIVYKIVYEKNDSGKLYFLSGLVIGFALYLQFHIVPFAITAGLFLFLNNKKIIFQKVFLFLLLGFVIGNAPLIIFNITHHFVTLKHIGTGFNNSTLLGTLKHLFGYGCYVILGAKPEYSQQNYIPFLSSLIIILYLLSFACLILKRKPGSEFLITFLLVFPLTYWLSGRGESNTRRYLLPLCGILPIVLAHGINCLRTKSNRFSYFIVLLVAGTNLYTNYQSITFFHKEKKMQYDSEIAKQKKLYNFLKSNNIKGAYCTDWWISLQFNFDFKENITLALIEDEPYPKYQKLADSQYNPAIVGYYSEFSSTLNSIGCTYKTEIIVPLFGRPPLSIEHDLKQTNKTLEEIDNSSWSAISAYNTKNTSLAFDRDIATRWNSGTPQKENMDFTIDLSKTYKNLTRICFNPGPKTDWPRGYKLLISIDGKTWKDTAQNLNFMIPTFWDGPHPFMRTINGLIELDFNPQDARYLKLMLTDNKEYFDWSIAEIYIYKQKEINSFVPDWNIDKLKERLKQLSVKRIHADPWVVSHLDTDSYYNKSSKEPYRGYIYSYFVIKQNRLKNNAFVVLQENYDSFTKILGEIPFNTEDFGQYRLVTFNTDVSNSESFYWDGFHLLKCTL